MDIEKLTSKRIYLMTGVWITITAAAMLATLYFLTENLAVLLCSLLFMVLMALGIAAFVLLMRKKLTSFSAGICRTLDSMMNGDTEPPKTNEEETLLARINYRLTRLYEVMQENNRRVAEERTALQELISDISHQVKMPIANLKIVNSTLLEQDVPEGKQREFLQTMGGQLDKLDFLMQALVKMSRLETGVITLAPKECAVYETLAAALGGILLAAESKSIRVSVDCPEDLTVCHDRKWTTEALFNILDNAVKYTASGGTIHVTVVRWELYTKIDISDTGKGIAENRQAEIFKRFYREEEVHGMEGIGIGLYLTREIIAMQGGYIKVISEVGKGSAFSVFLPNR
jgi:signal transduction histidine kinase